MENIKENFNIDKREMENNIKENRSNKSSATNEEKYDKKFYYKN